MSTIEIPAFCETCGAIFSSGIFIGDNQYGQIENNTVGPCPNGHMGRLMDGDFRVIHGVLNVTRAGPVTQAILSKIQKLAEDAEQGKIDQAEALSQALDLLPAESAAAIKKLSAHSPLALLFMIIMVLSNLSTIGSNIGSAYKAFHPDVPSPASINNNVTITNNIAPGQGGESSIAKSVTREQARRLKQMRAQQDKRAKIAHKQTQAECHPGTNPAHK